MRIAQEKKACASVVSEKPAYDETRDVGQVIPGLWPDINAMIETNTIPGTMSETMHNGLMELQEVGVRINDDFDAIIMARKFHSLKEQQKKAKAEKEKSKGD